MGCGKCHLYSRSLGRCKAGKVNPRTLKGTIQAMQFYGSPGTICMHNKYRVKAIKAVGKDAMTAYLPAMK